MRRLLVRDVNTLRLYGLVGAFAVFIPSVALADPCKAIPDRGPKPAWIKPGAKFSGVVRYIVDGDGFCVGGRDSASWIEVRMVDFDAPELREPKGPFAKAKLSDLILGREVRCTVRPGRSGRVTTHDRVLASCRLGWRSIASHLKAAGVTQGGL